MRKPLVASSLAFVLIVACGGKVADGASLGVASCTTTDPRGSSCGTAGDACMATLTSCDGTSAASTCYCTGQHLWSCDVDETACACIPGGTCAAAQPTCATRLQAACGWWYDVTCTCDDSTHTYSCPVPNCGDVGPCAQGSACSGGTCSSGNETCDCFNGTWQCTTTWDAGVGSD